MQVNSWQFGEARQLTSATMDSCKYWWQVRRPWTSLINRLVLDCNNSVSAQSLTIACASVCSDCHYLSYRITLQDLVPGFPEYMWNWRINLSWIQDKAPLCLFVTLPFQWIPTWNSDVVYKNGTENQMKKMGENVWNKTKDPSSKCRMGLGFCWRWD